MAKKIVPMELLISRHYYSDLNRKINLEPKKTSAFALFLSPFLDNFSQDII